MPKVPQGPNPQIQEIPLSNPATKIVVKLKKESSLPPPFKCAKCFYVAKGRKDFNEHYSLEH